MATKSKSLFWGQWPPADLNRSRPVWRSLETGSDFSERRNFAQNSYESFRVSSDSSPLRKNHDSSISKNYCDTISAFLWVPLQWLSVTRPQTVMTTSRHFFYLFIYFFLDLQQLLTYFLIGLWQSAAVEKKILFLTLSRKRQPPCSSAFYK